MASRSALLKCAAMESDEEYEKILLQAALRKTQPKKKWKKLKGVSSFSEAEVFTMGRFSLDDLQRLRTCLRLPDTIRIDPECYKISGDDALFLTLRRLSYPCRLHDIAREFNISKSRAGAVFNYVVNRIYDTWHHLLQFHPSRFGPDKLRAYTELIQHAGSPFTRCVGFIDGTCRSICRPQHHQRLLFSGHKRVHAIKFQSVVTPDGMISHLSGPYAGHRHDIGLLHQSGLLEYMKTSFRDGTGPYLLYGDAGYGPRSHIIPAFKGAALSNDKVELNRLMSNLRVSVEWRFGDILRDFAFVDYKKNQKLYLQPVGKYYVVSALLSNCRSSVYGNTVANLFKTTTPSLHEYLVL